MASKYAPKIVKHDMLKFEVLSYKQKSLCKLKIFNYRMIKDLI